MCDDVCDARRWQALVLDVKISCYCLKKIKVKKNENVIVFYV